MQSEIIRWKVKQFAYLSNERINHSMWPWWNRFNRESSMRNGKNHSNFCIRKPFHYYNLRDSSSYFAPCLSSLIRLPDGVDADALDCSGKGKSVRCQVTDGTFPRLKMNVNRMQGSRHRYRMNDIYWRMRKCELFSVHRLAPVEAIFHVSMKCLSFRFSEGKLVWAHLSSCRLGSNIAGEQSYRMREQTYPHSFQLISIYFLSLWDVPFMKTVPNNLHSRSMPLTANTIYNADCRRHSYWHLARLCHLCHLCIRCV